MPSFKQLGSNCISTEKMCETKNQCVCVVIVVVFILFCLTSIVRISIQTKCMLYSTENKKYINKSTNTQAHTSLTKLNPIHFRDYFFSVLSYVIRLIVLQSLVKNVTYFSTTDTFIRSNRSNSKPIWICVHGMWVCVVVTAVVVVVAC